MLRNNNKEQFLDTVGEQIRWKRARVPLLNELEAHICDHRDNLISEGLSEEAAEEKAVLEMGNAADIGVELDRVHRPRPNWALLGCMAGLLLLGLLLMWVVGDREMYMSRMLIYAGAGTAALVGGYFLDYTVLAKCHPALVLALCGACVVLQITGGLNTTATQLCFILPLGIALLAYRARDGRKGSMIMLSAGILLCFMAAALSYEWMSLSVYMFIVCAGLLFFAANKGWLNAHRGWLIASASVPVVVFAGLCITSAGSLTFRFAAGVFNPEAYPESYGWVPLRVRELLSTSRFMGTGSTGEMLESFISGGEFCSVNYMLAAASHQLGWFVFVLAAVLTTAAAVLIVRRVKRQGCGLGQITALTIALCFAVRALCYFVNNLGIDLFDMQGLPMFSYCGKLMVLDMFLMGILLSVFRTESIARDCPVSPESHPVKE